MPTVSAMAGVWVSAYLRYRTSRPLRSLTPLLDARPLAKGRIAWNVVTGCSAASGAVGRPDINALTCATYADEFLEGGIASSGRGSWEDGSGPAR